MRHALIAAPGLELDAIEVVVSHPQALAQCGSFLREELRDARVVSWTSTAEAVRVAAGRRATGGRRSGRSARRSCTGATSCATGSRTSTATRRASCGSRRRAPRPCADAAKTSLAFSGGGAAQPGWLVRCLSEFAFRGVNLTRIESRPRKDRLGDYIFFVDLEGGTGDERVVQAVDGLRAHCDQVRVLGSYPAA